MPLFSLFHSSKVKNTAHAHKVCLSRSGVTVQQDGHDHRDAYHTRRNSDAIPIAYAPIDSEKKQMRLLKLAPGLDLEPLRGHLEHTTLLPRRSTTYETVSYCWGEDPKMDVMFINNVKVKVRASATSVLRRMRSPTAKRLIWIDAICIDQSKKEEKSGQVAIMGDIYSNGKENFIWLGFVPDAKRTERAIRKVLSNIARSTKNPRQFRDLMADPPGAVIQDGKYLPKDTDWSALRELYCQQWFQRLWVAQEAALARKSVCHFGDRSLPLADVLNVAVWMVYNSLCLPTELVNEVGLYAARAMWYILDEKDLPSTDFFAAYIMAQNFKATDPRDHVYALRNLYHDQQPHLQLGKTLLRPAYESKSKEEVFRDATRAIIEDSGHLGVLQFVQPPTEPNEWPSWTLAFDVKTGLDKDPICRGGNGFEADNNTDEYPPRFISPSTLVVHGMRVDHVAETSARFCKARAWDTGEHSLMMDKVGKMIRKHRGHTNWVGELATTLVAGGIRTEDKTDVDDFVAFLGYSLHNSRQAPKAGPGSRYDEKNIRASRWFNAFELTMYGRRFFMTNIGFPGVGPLGMLPNDLIVILCGGSVPFVLRPQERKGEYTLVGVCYVFGIMHGEAAYIDKIEKMHIV